MKRNKQPSGKSLMEMTLDFIDRTVPDRRRTAVQIEDTGMEIMLLYKLAMDYTTSWFRIKEIENIMLFLRRKEDPILNTEVGFFYRENEDGVIGGTSEIARLPIAFYFAATYDRYDMETIEIHLDEIKDYQHIKPDWYLDCMAKHNKKLPDEVKLWLSLR